MSVLVRYANRATLTYSLTAHAPWEGYRVAFNGTEGRLELEVGRARLDPAARRDRPQRRRARSTRPAPRSGSSCTGTGAAPEECHRAPGAGGHGGGDRLLLNDVFRGPGDDPLGRQAGLPRRHPQRAVGVAANRSAATGLPSSWRPTAPGWPMRRPYRTI